MGDIDNLINPFENITLLEVNPIPITTQQEKETTKTESEEPTAWEVHSNNSDDTTNFSFNINPDKD